MEQSNEAKCREVDAKRREYEKQQEAARQERRQEKATDVPVVTQNTADNTPDGDSPMFATHGDQTPTQREIEQDVMMTNPSVESMESRG